MSRKYRGGYIGVFMFIVTVTVAPFLFQGCREAYDTTATGGESIFSGPHHAVTDTDVLSISGVIYGASQEVMLAPGSWSSPAATGYPDVPGKYRAPVPAVHTNLRVRISWLDDETGITNSVFSTVDHLSGSFFVHGLPGGSRSFVLTIVSGHVPIVDLPIITSSAGSTSGIKEYKLKLFVDTDNNTCTATQMEIAYFLDNNKRTVASFRMQAFQRKTLKNYGSGAALATPINLANIDNIGSLSALGSRQILDAFDESDYYFSGIYNSPGMDISPNDVYAAFKNHLLLRRHRFENRMLKDLGDDDDFSDFATLALIQDYHTSRQHIPTFRSIGPVEVILEPTGATSSDTPFQVGDIPRLALIFESSSRDRDMTIHITISDRLGNVARRRVVLVDNIARNDDGSTATDVYSVTDRLTLIPTLNVLSTICSLEGVFLMAGDYKMDLEITGFSGNSWICTDIPLKIHGQTKETEKHIFGTVAYDGAGTGEIRVEVYGDSSYSHQLLAWTAIESPGRFQISGLETSPVYVVAYQDQNANNGYDPMNGEPFGVYQNTDVWDGHPDPIDLSQSISDIDITIYDGYTFEIVDISAEVSIGQGTDEITYHPCTKVRVISGSETWYRYYAPRLGLVKDGSSVLVNYTLQPDDTLFPLAIGNKWRYRGLQDSSVEIIGTETVNGYLCYKARLMPENAIVWYRVQGNNVIQAGYRRYGQFRQNFRRDVKEMELRPTLGNRWGR